MAGGIGSRFWPMSRTNHPKQFLDILGTGKTLLQETYERFLSICPPDQIYVVTHESYIPLVKQQLPNVAEQHILGEPQRRNTAPCIAYACYKISKQNPNANIVVAPSDHVITKADAFTETIKQSLLFTEKNNTLLTLGMHPTRPDTGYGYIQFVDEHTFPDFNVCKVKTFTEKPNLEMAKFFLRSGEFLWNSGIFIWNLKSILEAFAKHLPEIHTVFHDGLEQLGTSEEEAFIRNAYMQVANVSIDYGIMEKAPNVYVLSADFGWSDLGTWGSLYEHRHQDENANAIVGDNVITYDTKNCIVSMPKDKLVILQGLDDCIVVESDGILLVCKKQDEQMIRQFVSDIKSAKGEKFL